MEQINKWYEIYEGEQEWNTPEDLDYMPTKKITNIIRNIIDTRARFMFGVHPDITLTAVDEKDEDAILEIQNIVLNILKDNKFHSKILKARKDASIAGRVGIKLWAHKDEGIKLIFMPAQEFEAIYSVEDIDKLEEVICKYIIIPKDEDEEKMMLIQRWYLEKDGYCYLDEGFYDEQGETLIEQTYLHYNTNLTFIPVIIIRNGGLTGDTEGKSDVARLWDNQMYYNKLSSDDIDALKFQMFGQTVFTDADEETMENVLIAPGALIDLQTDKVAAMERTQAKVERLESNFSYSDKYEETISRIRGDMYSELSVPDVSLEQLQGVIQSGKSMEAIYWSLMAACDEDWTEWGVALETMIQYIIEICKVYNIYDIPDVEYSISVEGVYPIKEDENELRKLDLLEVNAGVMSRKTYISKWGNVDPELELEQLRKEKQEIDEFYDVEWGS